MRRLALIVLLVAAAAELAVLAWPTRDETALSAGNGLHLVKIGTFTQPTDIVSAPNDPRLFIVQRTGQIKIVDASGVRATPFLDIHTMITTSGQEEGLVGLVFAPDYADSGIFYVYYTGAGSGDIVIAQYHVSSDPNVADPTGHTLLTIDHSEQKNHNGGQMVFGPDGYLYIGVGDGGGANGILGHQQDPTSLLGKILRIDPTTYPGGAPPPGQPILPLARPEIWAMGLRNPWRFSFDSATGNMLVGDVGQDTWEEVDDLPAGTPAGKNFGWNHCEGTHPFGLTLPIASPADCQGLTGLYVGPIWDYKHVNGQCSITGGFVTHDPGLGSLAGRYVYGDYCAGTIWSFTPATSGRVTDNQDTGLNVPDLTSFGEDDQGLLYVASEDGPVYRIDGPTSGTPNQPPVAAFTITPNPADVGAKVTLDGTGSHDPDGTIASYAWDTNGDGAPDATTATTSTTYSTPGVKTVTLTVTDNAGARTTVSQRLTVNGSSSTPPPPPSGSKPVPRVTAGGQALATVLLHGLRVTVRCNRPARFGLSVHISSSAAKNLGLHSKHPKLPFWIGSLVVKNVTSHTRTVHLRFTTTALKALRRVRPQHLLMRISAVATDNAGRKAATSAQVTITKR